MVASQHHKPSPRGVGALPILVHMDPSVFFLFGEGKFCVICWVNYCFGLIYAESPVCALVFPHELRMCSHMDPWSPRRMLRRPYEIRPFERGSMSSEGCGSGLRNLLFLERAGCYEVTLTFCFSCFCTHPRVHHVVTQPLPLRLSSHQNCETNEKWASLFVHCPTPVFFCCYCLFQY